MYQIKGAGSIEPRGKGTYRIRHNLGQDHLTGKYLYSPWRTVHGTKGDAQRALEEYRRELESGLRFDLRYITFSEFAESFQKERENTKNLAATTLEDDLCMTKHLNRYLGNIRIVDIDSMMIKGVIAQMVEEDVGKVRLHDLVIKLKQIMREAMLEGIILRNPCDRITTPKRPKPIRNSLKAFEAARLLQILDSRPVDRNIIAMYIGLATGMRRGEVFGLFWENIDLRDCSINITHAIDRKKNRKAPKSEAGIRKLSLDEHTVNKLKAWKKKQAEALLKEGISQNAKTVVCSSRSGGFAEPTRFYNWFKDFCVDNGFAVWLDDEGNELPKRLFDAEGIAIDENGRRYSRSNRRPRVNRHYKGLKFHELRHTHATLLIGNGVDIKTVQTRLGHSRASMTLDFYAHADEERDRKATDLFSSLIQSEAQQPKVVNL